AQELAQADETVTVGVHTRECLCIVVPLLAREPAIATAIKTAKPRLGPVTEPIGVRACGVVLPGGSAGPMRARPQLLAGEHAVAIPVVDVEGLIAALPLVT